jgi:aspartate/methionine/tyrosine aminotransferase
MTNPPLSKRGSGLLASPAMPHYITEHFERVADSWSPENPDGYIGLCIAENKLGFHLLQEKMAASRDVAAESLGYDVMIGSERFRRQLADFLSSRMLGRRVEPENIAVLAGAGTVLEILFYVLADPGEGVLIPTPSYAGFWPDLQTRDELRVVPVHTASRDNWKLTTKLLDEAIESSADTVKALLFTTPNNPLGTVYSREEVREIMDWGARRGIHVVFDEIFGLSVFGEADFVSAARVAPSLGDNSHIVWAFSKDFGMSGLRAGVLVSENPDIIASVNQLAYWGCCSGDTQHVLGELISDGEWVDAYIEANQALLRSAYRRTTAALEKAGIAYFPAEAGFFVVCDFRPFLEEVTWDAEHGLWRRFVDEARVNLTPGSECRIAEPGFMRLVFPSVEPEAVEAAIGRLAALLG